MFQLYKITNKINGKFYIGVHKGDIFEDGYYGSGLLIKRAITKHGYINFKRDVIDTYKKRKRAYRKEREFITEDLISSDKCYNLIGGGFGGRGENLRFKYPKGHTPWNKNKKMPDFSKHKHPRSLFNKFERHQIVQLYKFGDSSTEIAEKYDCVRQTIIYLLKSEGIEMRGVDYENMPTGEDHQNWIDKDENKICERYKDGETTYDISEDLNCDNVTILKVLERNNIKRRGNKKAVMQLLTNGVFVSTYESAYEASRSTGIIRTGISNTCTGYQKTSGGFKWRYVDYGF